MKSVKSLYFPAVALFALFIIATSAYWSVAIAKVAWYNFHNASLANFFNSRDAKISFEIGNYYFNGGTYDLGKAERYYKKSQKINSEYPLTNYQLSRIYFLRGDLKTSYYFINKELDIQPDFKRSYYIRGLVNVYSGNLSEAEKDFRSFIEFNPTSWAAHNDLAFVYWKMENYQRMKETAEKGLSFNPENPWLMITLGNSLLNLGEYEKAIKVSEKAELAVENMAETDWQKAYPGHHPSDAPMGISQMKSTVFFNEGLIYERMHQPEKAIASFEKFIGSGGESQSASIAMTEEKIASLKNQLN